MTISFGQYPVVFLLVLFRVAGLLLVVPFFGITSGSAWLLAGVSFPIALLFANLVSMEWVVAAQMLQTPATLAIAIVGEVLLGAAVGTICGVFVAIFNVAGSICSRATSLSMAEELDPMTGESSDVLSQFWRLLFLVIVLASDAHLFVFRILGRTFQDVPVAWMGWMNHGLDLAVLGGVAFRTGALLSLPVLLVSLVVSIVMGLMARMASEFNVLFLSLPFRLAIGLVTMAASVLYGGVLMQSVAQRMLTTIARYLGW
jgi:flagellar biosynthesis protein FliR